MQKKIISIFLLLGALFPFLARAGYYDDSLVPCGPKGPMCDLCYFVLMADRIFEFVLKISLAIAVLFAAIAGIIYIISSGSENLMNIAKTALKYALIGFGLCLLAWLLVQIIALALGYKKDWWKLEIECGEYSVEPIPDPDPDPKPQPTSLCKDAPEEKKAELKALCSDLLAKYNSGKIVNRGSGTHVYSDLKECSETGCVTSGKGSSCEPKEVLLNKTMLENLKKLTENKSVKWVGIGAIAGGTHSSCTSHHYSGTAIDVSHIYLVDGTEYPGGSGISNYLKSLGLFSSCRHWVESSHLHVDNCG